MKPLVSVVIPAYNNAAYLRSTIQAVLGQTYECIELLISDHASSDRTWEVMQEFSACQGVTLMRTEAGGGALKNWNRVSQEARGEYIKLVCGDDLIRPDAIAEQVKELEQADGTVLAASRRDLIDANGRRFVTGRGLGRLRGRVPGEQAIRVTVRSGTNIFGEPACVMMRRAALERAGWWDARFPYLIDLASYVNVMQQGDVIAMPRSLAAFRVSASQWSVRLLSDQATQSIGYFESLAAQHPALISAGDLRLGRARAKLAAQLRRVAYSYLGRRMQPS